MAIPFTITAFDQGGKYMYAKQARPCQSVMDCVRLVIAEMHGPNPDPSRPRNFDLHIAINSGVDYRGPNVGYFNWNRRNHIGVGRYSEEVQKWFEKNVTDLG